MKFAIKIFTSLKSVGACTETCAMSIINASALIED